jgi:hypothetical protein
MKQENRVSRSVQARRRKMDSLLIKPPEDLYVNNPPEYDDDGVNLTLLRWFLSLTPAQRLEALQQHLRNIEKMREARRRGKKKPRSHLQRKRNKKLAATKSRPRATND